MTMFGFMVGTVLVNTLFAFDVFISKYQRRASLWGSTMIFVVENYTVYTVTPLWTLVCLWLGGLLFGNTVNPYQILVCACFWAYMISLYITSTYYYYKWKIPEMKNK